MFQPNFPIADINTNINITTSLQADGCMLPALVVAAGNGHLDIIQLLLQSGKVDINQQSSDVSIVL